MFEHREMGRTSADIIEDEESEAAEPGSEEVENKPQHYTDRLQARIITEDNEDIIRKIVDELNSASHYYETTGKPEDWQKFWTKMEEIAQYIESDDVEGAEGVWVDAELELRRLKH